MAATNVYVTLAHLPLASFPGQVLNFPSFSATTATFTLKGGLYVMSVVGSTFGTVTLQVLGPDTVTWLNALAGVTANGTAAGYLAPGTYRIDLT